MNRLHCNYYTYISNCSLFRLRQGLSTNSSIEPFSWRRWANSEGFTVHEDKSSWKVPTWSSAELELISELTSWWWWWWSADVKTWNIFQDAKEEKSRAAAAAAATSKNHSRAKNWNWLSKLRCAWINLACCCYSK